MKVAFVAGLLVSVTEAFTSSSTNYGGARPSTMINKMSEEEPAEEEEVAAAPAPVADTPAKVPCFGATPFVGGTVFLGEPVWDKLTMDWGSAQTGDFLRAAEIKHGRSAMLATVGFAFEKLGITFDKISPHEYLSVTQDIKFADLAALGPVDAVKAIPGEGWAQIFTAIAAIEIYELTHREGEIKEGESVPPGLQAGGLTGALRVSRVSCIGCTEPEGRSEKGTFLAPVSAIYVCICLSMLFLLANMLTPYLLLMSFGYWAFCWLPPLAHFGYPTYIPWGEHGIFGCCIRPDMMMHSLYDALFVCCRLQFELESIES